MFECKVCKEKDKRIAYLEKQVERLFFRLGVPTEEMYKPGKGDVQPLEGLEESQEKDESVLVFGGE